MNARERRHRTAEARLSVAARIDRGAALLMRAALHPDADVACAAWDRLVADAGGHAEVMAWADAGAGRRILPALGTRAELLELPAAVTAACRDATAEAWGLNERLLVLVEPAVAALVAADIPVVALKGLALLGDVHPAHRLRPLGDADLLVPRRLVRRAFAVLAAQDWTSPDLREPFLLATRQAVNLGGPVVGPSIDVHWRSGLLVPHRPVHQPWPAAHLEPVPAGHPLAGSGLLRPVPELLLVQLAAHGMAWTENSPHWLADLAAVVRTHGPLDADRVRRIAEPDGLAWTVRAALRACRDVLGTDAGAALTTLAPRSARSRAREARRWAAQAGLEASYRDPGPGPALRRLRLQGLRDAPGLPLTRAVLLGVAAVNWVRSRGGPIGADHGGPSGGRAPRRAPRPTAAPARRG